ncbi:hypothetical protein GOPIP_104_00130 [Gordonia polyisoprenivorans NBRC 16320 = JCM 10675]|uniref:Uncharacterized protein n=1 Tax=Gordonia polyisoprenivorans TaxID=84595 RepID=A0A846WVU7_9ACTN|nr:hypothetical protein [Gordonia polyisoprenivorans]NKY04850.1 hypothetical protein [Gordonia polyisoprenivorans]OZC30823.1 hypothetical protein CJJ17_04645 [Gordonia polyisoprenivorans]GAB26473.1 hypothetical protein GOPIP_104_00130 [Gordonia polyisoprenivorans NBRC 16320 = JCM 10675]
MTTPHIDPPEDDGWTAYTWVRAAIGDHLTVDLISGHNLLTDKTDAPVIVIGDRRDTVEVNNRRELDGLIAALNDARAVWDALNS